MKDGGPAFPYVGRPVGENTFELFTQGGMSLRDYFAGQALTMVYALQANEDIAKSAYDIADAMLAAREGANG